MMAVQPATPPGARIAYWCHVLLGTGMLFPWNAVITAADYWEARYPGKHTDRLLTVCYLPPNLLVIAALVHWHGRLRPKLRVVAGLLGFTLAVGCLPLVDLAPPTAASLAAVLLLVALCGVCDGLSQGALFGEAALLPPRYTQGLMAGTAVSGVAVSLLRVSTKATLPATPAGLRASANLYFLLAAAVCGACLAVYSLVLPRLPAVRQYRHAALQAALRAALPLGGSGAGAGGHNLHKESGNDAGAGAAAGQDGLPGIDLELHSYAQLEQQTAGAEGPHDPIHPAGEAPTAAEALLLPDAIPSSGETFGGTSMLQPAGRARHSSGGKPARIAAAGPGTSAWAVLPLVWQLALANMLIYIVTLSIFPGVLAEDQHSAELGSWYPILLITAFMFADMAGKSLPGVRSVRLRNHRAILGATLGRLLFIPAFHFAAVGGAGPFVIGLLAMLLGLSNGYLTSCAMMEGPAAAPASLAEQAGNVMVLFLILGLCLGAACGFLWLL